MKSRLLKVCSMVIIMALLVQLLPLQALALALDKETPETSVEAQDQTISAEKIAPDEPATILGEITAKRTEFSKEYKLSNGLSLAVVYPEAVHYQKNGQWEDIDTTLTAKNGVYTATASPWNVSFPQQLSKSNAITVELNGHTVSFGMAGELRGSADAKLTTSEMGKETATLTVAEMQTSNAQLQTFDYSAEKAGAQYPETVPDKLRSRLTYSNVYSNTNVVYDLSAHKLKESVVIAKYDPELQGYRYTLDTGKLVPVLNDDNSITLIDPATKEAILNMPAPYMIDSAGEISNDVEVALTSDGSAYTLMYRLPAQWMADEARSWPVVLDPVVEATSYYSNVLDVYVTDNTEPDNNLGCLFAGLGSSMGRMRTYIQYVNLPDLTSSGVVVNATLSLLRYAGSTTAGIIEAHAVEDTWHSSSVTWEDQPEYDTLVEDYVLVGNNGWYTWNVTHIAQEWYESGNTGVMLKAPDSVENGSTTNWHKFYSIDWDYTDNNTTGPVLQIAFRNTNGLESYWDYTSHSAGRAGTGYVNNYSGNLVWVHNDIGFGGNRMPVSISHIYNANDCASNAFGMGNGWRTNYNQTVSVYAEADGYYVWDDSDGTKHYFFEESEGVYKDEDNLNLTLTTTGSGTTKYKIVDQYGNASYFDTSGRLTKIENNQATKSSINITYQSSSSQLISTIKDGAGRTYNFSYTNGLLTKISYKGNGSTEISYISFGYTGSKLTSVTYKDGKQVHYGYSGNYLTSCTDIDGYKLQYSYSSTQPKRVIGIQEKLTGATEGGSITFQYAHNQTTLTDHNGNANILQFNDWGNVVSVQDGEGRAQYAQYARNNYKSDTAGKANQMTLSSKLQNTVNNQLMHSSYELNNLWNVNSSTVTMEHSQEAAYLGDYSLKVTSTVSNNSYGVYSENITVKPGETITFSAYVKATGTPVQLAFHCNNYEGYNFVTRGEEMQPTGEWERMEVTYTNTTNATLKMSACLFCQTAGTAYMDCVQAEIAPTPSRYNMLQNGDFAASGYWSTSAGRVSLASSEETAAPNLNSYVYKFTGSPTATNTISQTVTVNGSEGDTFILGGWAKGDSVPLNNENRRFGLRLKFNYTDGTVAEDTIVSFNPATGSENKWQFASVPAVAKGTYSSVTVYLEYSYNANTAYFDGIQLFKEEFGSSYTYDEDGNVISVVDLQKQETKYEYDTDNNLTKIIQNNKAKVTYTYDDYHNVETATTYEGIVYEFGYDTYGNNTSVSIVNGNTKITSTATYSTDGNRLESTTDALDKTTTYSYNAGTGMLEWVKYPNDTDSTRTEYTYDTMYRLATAVADIDANTTLSASYTYDNDLLTQITTGSTTYAFSYNSFSQRTGISIGSRNLATYTYTNDKNRYLSQLVYGNQDMVQYTYDNLGRVILETYEDGSTVSYAYDNNGALATVTDSETGIKTTYYYDFTDRLMKYVEKGTDYSHSVGYEYDILNNLTHMVEAINGVKHTTAYTYDEDNRIVSIINGINDGTIDQEASRDYTYDNFGRVTQRITKQNGTVLLTDTISYVGNSTQVASITTVSDGYSVTYSYTYDNNGNISTVSDGTYCTQYFYDTANQLIRENNQQGNYTCTWIYDNAGNILSRTVYPYTTGEPGQAQDSAAYTYGDSTWGDLLTAYNGSAIAYDAIGNPTNDGIWEYVWKQGRQLVYMYGEDIGGEVNDITAEYIYNADGMRIGKRVTKRNYLTHQHSYAATVIAPTCTEDGYTLHECSCGDSYQTDETAALGHDYAESVYVDPDTSAIYTVYSCTRCDDSYMDHTHSYTSTVVAPTCTGAGYTLHECVCGYSYKTDSVPQLGHSYIMFTNPKTGDTTARCTRCGYTMIIGLTPIEPGQPPVDTMGLRMVNDTDSEERTLDSTVVQEYAYVYNGGTLMQMVIETTVDDGAPVTETLSFSYDASGKPMNVIYNGTAYFYTVNLQCDVIAILDENGNCVVEYNYDAWGNILSVTGTMADTLGESNPLRYRGYVYDHETNLYYLQSRYYSPEWGRFLNADALVATGQGMLGNNMFAYCRNNPVNRKDASGTEDVSATDFNEDDNPLNDIGSPSGSGGGGVVGKGDGGNKASGTGASSVPKPSSVNSGSPAQNTDTPGSKPSSGKMRTPDQQALHDLAREVERNAHQGKFISHEEAQLLDSWAKEYGVYQHHGAIIGSGEHWKTGWDHTHIYNIHVPFATIY